MRIIKASRPFSKLASHAYSKKQIEKKSREGSHKGDSMKYVFQKIMNDPDIELGEPDKSGNRDIFYKGKNIGWMNPTRGIGWVDDSAYDKLQPYSESSEGEDITSSRRITSTKKIETRADLKDAISDALDQDLCTQVVNLAFSEDGTFDKNIFVPSEDFYDTLDYKDDPERLALMFFNGEDMDSKGPANPNRKYFRLGGDGNIESTDYPEEIYFDELYDDVVEYILDHIDDMDFPKIIQELIDEYQNTEED